MSWLEIGLAAAAAVVLFLFGIEHFSAEIQAITGQRFRDFLARGTDNRFAGFALGAGVTAVIQSSTATSVIAVGLVNAGVLSFRQSLGVLFGANVGTTVTAQLVALHLTDFAPALILLGFVASLLPFRWRVFGRSIFYFGLVFFSLQLVGTAVEPLKSSPELLGLMGTLDNPLLALLVGAVVTALVQSSSVTTGVAIVLMAEGAISLEAAVPLVLGANIGTTSTALVASAQMDTSARRTATSHILYNVLGVLIFLPLLGWAAPALRAAGLEGGTALATAHLVFNLATACLFLALLEPFARLVERLIPDEAGEERPVDRVSPQALLRADTGNAEILRWAGDVIHALSHGYTAAVLAIETRDRAIDARARRTAALLGFALEEASSSLRTVSDGEVSTEHSEVILRFVVTIDHMRQLQDSLGDLMALSTRLEQHHARLSIEALIEVQSVFPVYARFLQRMAEYLAEPTPDRLEAVRAIHGRAQDQVQQAYRQFLVLVRERHESAELADFLSIHQRLRTKLASLVSFLDSGSVVPPPGIPFAAPHLGSLPPITDPARKS